MKRLKRILSLTLAVVMALGMMTMTSYAASKKITSVNLRINADIKVGTSIDSEDVEVTSTNTKYTVESWELQNEGFEWFSTDVPELKVTLAAKDGYYFSLAASNVKLNGATYVKGVKEDSARTLVLTMKLPALNDQVGEVESVSFGTDGAVSWDAATGAGSYEVRLLRDGSVVGRLTVTETSCNVSEWMIKEGNYHVRVRGVNAVDPAKKSASTESNYLYLNPEQAEAMRAKSPSASGWVQDSVGWWYRNQDGSYTRNNWHKIDNQWYYFGDNGYMMTGWIQVNGIWYYCDTVSGAMWANATTPDGYQVDASGALIP
ncbi:MAG: cell wall-binding protein [Lachnospiraceae bacterium]